MSDIAVSVSKKSTRTPSLELEIKQHIADGKLGGRAVDEAFVKPVPKTGETWHTNVDDPREHITVEFKMKGKHVTTHHVIRTL